MSLNFGVTLVGFLTPMMLLAYYGVIGTTLAIVLAGVGLVRFSGRCFTASSRSWWLMNYYFFLPQHLPANRAANVTVGDENT